MAFFMLSNWWKSEERLLVKVKSWYVSYQGPVIGTACLLVLYLTQALGKGPEDTLFYALFSVLLLGWARAIHDSRHQYSLAAEQTRTRHREEMEFAADALATEAKNPLGMVIGIAQKMANNPQNPQEVTKMAEKIQDAADCAAARLGEFISYSKIKCPRVARIQAEELVQLVITALLPDFDGASVGLTYEVDDVVLLGDRNMMTQMLVNILRNSLRACGRAGLTKIIIKEREGMAHLTIVDNGCGMNEELIDKAFVPYVSGHVDGHGLGLAIVKKIADLHDWSVFLKSREKIGTEITVSPIAIMPK